MQALARIDRPAGAPEVGRDEPEELLALEVGAGQAIATRSAAQADRLALAALDLAPGDEVVVPAGTRREIVAAVLDARAHPVFADVDPLRGCVTTASVAARLTPRTRAVLVRHAYGAPAPVSAVAALTHCRGAWLVEDATEAGLAVLPEGERAGTVGDLGIVGLGHGANGAGLVLTDDRRLGRRLRQLRGAASAPVGWADGTAPRDQLGWAVADLATRRSAGLRLAAALPSLPGLTLPPDLERHALSAFPLIIDPLQVGVTNAEYADDLTAAGVRVLTRHQRQPLYRVPRLTRARPTRLPAFGPGSCPVAEDRVGRTLVLLDWPPAGPVDVLARAITRVHRGLVRRHAGRIAG